jgi:hypothetical protein
MRYTFDMLDKSSMILSRPTSFHMSLTDLPGVRITFQRDSNLADQLTLLTAYVTRPTLPGHNQTNGYAYGAVQERQ